MVEHICDKCKKTFTRKNNLHRHQKNRCKIIKEQEKEKKNILNKLIKINEETNKENLELKKEISEIIKNNKINKTINKNVDIQNIITNNLTTNIQLIAYGKEDLSKIDKNEIMKALSRGFNAILIMTETIHFNLKYPEYHNIYISNIKDKYAKIYNGSSWNLVLKTKTINDLYNKKKELIINNIDGFNNSSKKSLERWLNTPEEDKKIIEIKEELQLLLFNKRNMIKNNFKEITDF